MNSQRNLLVISGPAGSGKDTVVRQIIEQQPGIELSVSATTRAPRQGEQHGQDYFFVSKEDFEEQIKNGGLVEYTHYVGNYYGTLKSEIEKHIANGRICVLVIEVEGAQNIKKLYPESTSIFLMPPCMEELERRLRGRGSENEEQVQKRLQRAKQEMQQAVNYDFVVVNNTVEECANEILQILEKRRSGESQ